MRKHSSLVVCLTFLSTCLLAETGPEWGSGACGAQCRVLLAKPEGALKVDQPINLVFQVHNISNATLSIWEMSPREDFTIDLRLPSGKQFKLGGEKHLDVFRVIHHEIKPNETTEFPLDLISMYHFTEKGDYKIVVKRNVMKTTRDAWEMTSNPLTFTLR
jgi:hypothetical protein